MKFVFITRENFGGLLLGPCLRIVYLAQALERMGHDVVIYGLAGSLPSLINKKVEFRTLNSGYTRSIPIDAAVIVGELIPLRYMHELLKSGLGFYWDIYGMSYLEMLTFSSDWERARKRKEFLRRKMRYLWMAQRANAVIFSNSYQSSFFSGMLQGYVKNSGHAHQIASLHAKFYEIPMGIRDDPHPKGTKDPYPEQLKSGPIFLWGGGIWRWFDIEGLLKAFALMKDRCIPGSLFFISGINESTSDYDAPLLCAYSLSESLGVLGKNVFFNQFRVGIDDLPAYLEHCDFGVMANCANLESASSWRTRYSDLVWAGKPLLAMGSDPFAEKLASFGAAKISPAGDVCGFVNMIQSMDENEINRMSKRSLEFKNGFVWSEMAAKLERVVHQHQGGNLMAPPTIFEWVRYVAAI